VISVVAGSLCNQSVTRFPMSGSARYTDVDYVHCLVAAGEGILPAVIVLASTISHSEPAMRLHDPCRISYPSDERVDWESRTLRTRESLETLFGEPWIHVARFNRIDRRHVHAGVSIKVPKQIEASEAFYHCRCCFWRPSKTSRSCLSI